MKAIVLKGDRVAKYHGNNAGGQAEYNRVPYANIGPKKVPEGLTDEQVVYPKRRRPHYRSR